jgi:hypothetical protein
MTSTTKVMGNGGTDALLVISTVRERLELAVTI